MADEDTDGLLLPVERPQRDRLPTLALDRQARGLLELCLRRWCSRAERGHQARMSNSRVGGGRRRREL